MRIKRKRQNTRHPQFGTSDVDRFCGGGAWVSRSERAPIAPLMVAMVFDALLFGCFSFQFFEKIGEG